MKSTSYIAMDGHIVKSRAELVIDNFLYSQQILHEYEKEITLKDKRLSPDWYLSEYGIYIEFWGMESDRVYSEKQLKKLKLYAESRIRFLSLNNSHLENGPHLEKSILSFIKVAKEDILKEKKSEQQKQEEINRIKAEADAKVKDVEERSQSKIKEMEQRLMEVEAVEELAKFMGGAITWTVNGIQSSLANIIKSQKNRPSKDRNCVYCKRKLIISRHICKFCLPKILTKSMCIFCGSNVYKSKICAQCMGNIHHTCRLCKKSVSQPQVGKPVCDSCVLKIPQIFK